MHANVLRALLGIMVVLLCRYMTGVIHEPQDIAENDAFSGIISLYDVKNPTILGNGYSVIETICEEYSTEQSGAFVRLRKINSVTEDESYTYAAGYADIICYRDGLDSSDVMKNEDFTASLDSDHPELPAPYHSGRVIVPLWYDIYVMVIKSDLAQGENVAGWSMEELWEYMNENSVKAVYARENVVGIFSVEKYNSYFPPLCDMLTKGDISAFFNEDCGVFFGSLKDVKPLLRRQMRGEDIPDYEIHLIPSSSDREKCVYVSEIYSYAAKDSHDEAKNREILRFMRYLQSPEAQRYTENLGYLPWVGAENVAYEKYPYLKDFALSRLRHIIVE